MKQEIIDKLPPDVKKEFMKYAIKLSQKKTENKVKNDFLSFVKHVWPEFIEGKHHKIMAEKFNRVANGDLKRLMQKKKDIQKLKIKYFMTKNPYKVEENILDYSVLFLLKIEKN